VYRVVYENASMTYRKRERQQRVRRARVVGSIGYKPPSMDYGPVEAAARQAVSDVEARLKRLRASGALGETSHLTAEAILCRVCDEEPIPVWISVFLADRSRTPDLTIDTAMVQSLVGRLSRELAAAEDMAFIKARLSR